jgi:hypothetical protein
MTVTSMSASGANFESHVPTATSGAAGTINQTVQVDNNQVDVCPITLTPYNEIEFPAKILNENNGIEPAIYEAEALQKLSQYSPISPMTRLKIKEIIYTRGSPPSLSGQGVRQVVDLQEPQLQEIDVHTNFGQKILKCALKAGVFVLKVLASIALISTMIVGYTVTGAILGLVIPGALIGIVFGTFAGIRISQNVFWEGKDLFCEENKNIAYFFSESRSI